MVNNNDYYLYFEALKGGVTFCESLLVGNGCSELKTERNGAYYGGTGGGLCRAVDYDRPMMMS